MHWSRRAWLASLPVWSLGAASDKGRVFASEVTRYADPATEFPVGRLTNPEFTSLLPAPYAQFSTHKGTHIVYSSDRTGSMQAYRMDMKTGESRLITEATALDPASLNLSLDEKLLFFRDGRRIHLLGLNGTHERGLYETPEDWQPVPGMCLSMDGVNLVISESRQGKSRILVVPIGAKSGITTVAEVNGMATDCQPRPKRASVLYRLDNGLWMVNFDGQQNRRLATPPNAVVGSAFWSADGRLIQYLSTPDDKSKLATIREIAPDTGKDVEVARTTQYLSLSRNADSNVFLGASRSLASPHILLLVRSVKRELTLCEHKAKDPRIVCPVFSPTSQRIFFVTDRYGKPCICTMNVERLVEKTESGQS